ncbi:MAG: hypothetical protein BWX80_02008 [Candidatus Hydrogenedentes bacterium ADurb.Bin101]|nr:MAG: hypothetical protein BWX80_02008 [Candidatus Hydrogenedentes bacterium ADurb.Bin101]
MDQIPDDQEIIHKAHADDNAQLVFHPFDGGGRQRRPIAFLQPLIHPFPKIGLLVLPVGHRVAWNEFQAGGHGGVAAFRDKHGIGYGLGPPRKAPFHLSSIAKIKLVVGQPHPVRILQGLLGLQTEQNIVGFRIRPVEVVAVIGGDDGYFTFLRQVIQQRVHLVFFRHAVIHHLYTYVIRPENADVLVQRLFRFFRLSRQQHAGNASVKTGRRRDQSLMVFFQQRDIDARFIVPAFQVGLRTQLAQIVVALFVLAQEQEVVAGFLAAFGRFIEPVCGRHVYFAPQNGFDAFLLGLLAELKQPEYRSVVRYGACRHIILRAALDQFLGLGQAVQQAEMTVQMKVYKISAHVPPLPLLQATMPRPLPQFAL